MAFIMQQCNPPRPFSSFMAKNPPHKSAHFAQPGHDVEPQTLPKEIYLETRNPNIADLFSVGPDDDSHHTNAYYYGTTERLKDLIEIIEKDVVDSRTKRNTVQANLISTSLPSSERNASTGVW